LVLDIYGIFLMTEKNYGIGDCLLSCSLSVIESNKVGFFTLIYIEIF
jgi:hypothetical protein